MLVSTKIALKYMDREMFRNVYSTHQTSIESIKSLVTPVEEASRSAGDDPSSGNKKLPEATGRGLQPQTVAHVGGEKERGKHDQKKFKFIT